jgi:beta-galactosidase
MKKIALLIGACFWLAAAGAQPARQRLNFDEGWKFHLIGVGNGNPSSHEPDKYTEGDWQRRLFNGKCQVIVQSDLAGTGEISFSATGAAGLQPVSVRLQPGH